MERCPYCGNPMYRNDSRAVVIGVGGWGPGWGGFYPGWGHSGWGHGWGHHGWGWGHHWRNDH